MNGVAKRLIGETIDGRWKIESERRVDPAGTGGTFSHGFIARSTSGEEVFVKVLDIRLNRALPEPLKDLEVRIQRFNYESEIARSCAAERLSRVAHAIADGVLQIGGAFRPTHGTDRAGAAGASVPFDALGTGAGT